MEKDFREVLVASNKALQDSTSKLKAVLESYKLDTESAYVLHWIPDQTDDTYGVLIEA